MSNVVRKRLEPCQKSLQRLSDIALCARKEKKKEDEGQSDMGENIGAHRKIPQYLLVKQETSALCHVQKADPTETNVSRANRVKQNSHFHNVDKGDILEVENFVLSSYFAMRGRS